MANKKELLDSEYSYIAMCLGCSSTQVRFVSKGYRKKRNTPLQQKIQIAIAERIKRNAEFMVFCKQIVCTSVSPQ